MSKYNEFCKKCGAHLDVPVWTVCEKCTPKKRFRDKPVIKHNEAERVKYKKFILRDPKYLQLYRDATVLVFDGNDIVGYSNSL